MAWIYLIGILFALVGLSHQGANMTPCFAAGLVDWEYFDGRCYKESTESVDRPFGQVAACQSVTGTRGDTGYEAFPVAVETQEELDFIESYFATDTLWFGCNNQQGGNWTCENANSNNVFTLGGPPEDNIGIWNWADGFPIGNETEGECLAYSVSSAKIVPLECTTTAIALCEVRIIPETAPAKPDAVVAKPEANVTVVTGCSAGWEIKDRAGPDSPGWTMVAPSQVISCDGLLSAWQYQAKNSNPFRAIVWRPVPGSSTEFQIIGINDIPAAGAVDTEVTYKVPSDERIAVQAGDMIGWSHGAAVLTYNVIGDTLVRWVGGHLHAGLQKNQTMEIIEGLGNREYSIRATVEVQEKKVTPEYCRVAPLGMENGNIMDVQLNSSTEWDQDHAVTNARLNYIPNGETAGGWLASLHDLEQWVQVDLLEEHTLSGLIMQGRETSGDKHCNGMDGECAQWITAYKVSYGSDGLTWNYVTNSTTNIDEIFTGNSDRRTPVQSLFEMPVLARYIRIHPWRWNNFISLRFELLGCLGYSPRYIGCYIDVIADRAVPDDSLLTRTSSLTQDFCINHCGDNNRRYAVVQNAKTCRCGENGVSYDRHGKVPDSECNMGCTGDSSQTCGGPSRNAVFDLWEIRLVPVDGEVYSGIEVSSQTDMVWKTICDEGWDPSDAKVTCTQLGYNLVANSFDGIPTSMYNSGFLTNVECLGTERSIQECPYNTTDTCSTGAGVLCINDDDITFSLADGFAENQGNVVMEYQGTSGYICDDYWDKAAANVICNQLGFAGAESAITGGKFGKFEGYSLNEVNCTGDESNLLLCTHSGFGSTNNCSNYRAAGVTCQPRIRLMPIKGELYSRVEAFSLEDMVWKTICDDGWDPSDAKVACTQVGYYLVANSFDGIPTSMYNSGFLTNVECLGTERSIQECPYNKTDTCSTGAGALCINADDIIFSLADGFSENQGNVVMEYQGTSGYICDDYWDMAAANVICNQLGFAGAELVITGGKFGEFEGYSLNEVDCVGNETNLMLCTHSGFGSPSNCSNYRAAGVTCQPRIRLSDIEDSEFNEIKRVETFENGTWYTVCDEGWDPTDGKVACTQLGYPLVGNIFFGVSVPGESLLTNLQCEFGVGSLEECTHDISDGNCTGAGVLCLGVDAVTFSLADGFSENRGNVAITYQDGEELRTGYVCDDDWDIIDANIVCNQLGFDGAVEAISKGGSFGDYDSFLLSNVNCTGDEENLLYCTHGGLGSHECLNYEVAGVVCQPRIRLSEIEGALFKEIGRVETYDNGTWYTVCHDGWDPADGKVACTQLGYPLVGNVYYGVTVPGEARLTNLQCELHGDSLNECPYDISDGNCSGAGLLCLYEDDVTFSLDGDSDNAGQVRVHYKDDYGYVCDDAWDIIDAGVLCRQLGFEGAEAALIGGSFVDERSQYYLDNMNCTGDETSLLYCEHGGFGSADCDGQEVAAVICTPSEGQNVTEIEVCDYCASNPCGESYNVTCTNLENGLGFTCLFDSFDSCPSNETEPKQPELRLRGGLTDNAGRVEVFRDGQWGSVCSNGFGVEEGWVVCYTLGYDLLAQVYVDLEGVPPLLLDNLECNGDEESLGECGHSGWGVTNCTLDQVAGVTCLNENDVHFSLQGGPNPWTGTPVLYYNGGNGSICDDSWDLKDGDVLCRQLGFGKALEVNLKSSLDMETFFMDDVECIGNETNVLYCDYSGWDNHNCGAEETASVQCDFKGIRLGEIKDASFDTIGRVEVYEDGEWYSICDDGWGVDEGKVACTQLGYSLLGNLFFQTEIPGEALYSNLRCNGNETNLRDCDYETPVSECTGAALLCLEESDVSFSLTGGNSTMEGNVLVEYEGTSGYVCDDGWNITAANVICRQLGFKGAAEAYSGSVFGDATEFYMDNVNCYGDEPNLLYCEHGGFLVSDCGVEEAAGVLCEPIEDGTVRLSKGSDEQGLLEIYYRGEWGSVCDTEFDMREASIVCNQLGFPSVNTFTSIAERGDEDTMIWLADLGCEGTEESLADCNGSPWGETNCDHSQDISVACSDLESIDVRLVNGDERSGLVEVFYDGEWGTVCDDFFELNDAHVVCHSVGLPGAESFSSTQSEFGKGTGAIVLDDLGCFGTESSLLECKHRGWGIANCFHNEDVSVVCERSKDPREGDLRLFDGDDESNGRLAIFHDNRWGSICDDEWNENKLNNARVACNQLGFTYVNVADLYQVPLGSHEDPIWLDNVVCDGTEDKLTDCSGNEWEVNDCTHYEDVGISCLKVDNLEVRLSGGKSTFDGKVEVNYDGEWGSVCDDKFDMADANVVCRMLGSPSAVNISNAEVGNDVQPIWLDDLLCTGNETTLLECLHAGFGNTNCRHNEDVAVVCAEPEDGSLRLVGGKTSVEGRVEIFHDGSWGTVCDDQFGFKDANVICRQLGFSFANNAHGSARFGEGDGPIWIDELECNGDESRVDACSRTPWGENNCQHGEDAGVECIMLSTPFEIRLVGDNVTEGEGRVEVNFNGEWGTICDDSWDINDATVVCRSLGYYKATKAGVLAEYGEGTGTIMLDDVACTGSESSLLECGHRDFGDSNCQHSEDASVVCAEADEGTLRQDDEGRLQVFYNSDWGTVCNDQWHLSLNNARVACRELTGGHPAQWYSLAGEGAEPIWLDEVSCSGEELTLAECPRGVDIGASDCQHTEDVVVQCLPEDAEFDTRLVGGESETSGRVEFYINGAWGSVCDDLFGLDEANVVCRQLGYNGAEGFEVVGGGNSTIWFDNVDCNGNEANLLLCNHAGLNKSNCAHDEDVAVSCAPPDPDSLRLVDGRLEIYHDKEWGTVCDDDWDFVDASVACKQLGFEYANSVITAGILGIQPGTGKIWLDNVQCTGSEKSLSQCEHNGWEINNCGHSEDAGVSCIAAEDYGGIRLTGGASDNEGRVELNYQGDWGSVCDDNWDLNAANVACRQLGFTQGAEREAVRSEFSPGTLEIILDDVQCSGSEENLLDCQHSSAIGEHNCGDSEYAGAVCIPNKAPENGDIRLVSNDTSADNGRLEILYDGEWGTVCNQGWTYFNAHVACQQLGFLGAENYEGPVDHKYDAPIFLDGVGCDGTEPSLTNCTYLGWGPKSNTCDHSQDVYVQCLKERHNLRLVDGSTNAMGRVEIYYKEKWGTLCDDNWSIEDANVVCRQLGYINGAVAAIPKARYGEGEGAIILDEIQCSGTEEFLSGCLHVGFGEHNCNHNEDAGVVCDTGETLEVRLVGGTAPNEGRVEIYLVDEWGSVCDDQWDIRSGNVICRMLGYPGASEVKIRAFFGQGNGSIILDDTSCSGWETSIDDCEHKPWGETNCKHTEDAGVICFLEEELPIPVRLADGISPSEGRVELFFRDAWGTVCDDNWDLNDADVICNSLGYNGATEFVTKSGFGPGAAGSPIFLDETDCAGNETAVEQCNHNGFGVNNCAHTEDAGVKCREWNEGDLRLVGGSTPEDGRVEIYHDGEFGTICDDSWDLNEVTVVCNQLGFPGAAASTGFNAYPGFEGQIWMDDLRCTGLETALSECEFDGWGTHNCGHAEDVGVRCQPKTAQPNGDGITKDEAPIS